MKNTFVLVIAFLMGCTCGVQAGPTEGFALIPAGSFQMGEPLVGGYPDEKPVHTVKLNAFYMEKTLVTNEAWDAVTTWGFSHSYTDLPAGSVSGTCNSGKGMSNPVVYVNWYDVVKWCNARSERDGLTPCYATETPDIVYRTGNSDSVTCNWSANGYRLPTEAEWEKAARGGLSGKRFPWGDTITHSQANYISSPAYSYDVSPTRGYHPTFAAGVAPHTSPVGSFPSNGYGLYDMAGNAWERCWDWYAPYSNSSVSNPQGPASGSCRVFRGGSWYSYGARGCRTSHRGYYFPVDASDYVSFRSVRSSP